MVKAEITEEVLWKHDFSGTIIQETVWIGCQGYPYRNNEKEKDLPTQRAWCKKCAKNSAKIVAPIWLNGRPAYALKCEKCGNMHHMYVHMYRQRYIGVDTMSGGHLNPTYGINSFRDSMNRKAREHHRDIPKKVEDDMCKLLNVSHEEYREMKNGWEEEDRKTRKRIEAREAEDRARWQEEKIQEESEKRKELIKKGVLKYVKGVGLVNTETGQVVKL